jgi:soluble lytic murein transglycosylase-like protein
MATGHRAQADVLQLSQDGAVQWRRGAGAVVWGSGEAAPALPASGGLIPVSPVSRAPAAYAPLVASASAAHRLDPALLEALVWQESRWHNQALSPKGAMGLGQLMPATARALGVDPRDPAANLHGTARYLRQQLDLFGGNVPLALAAYNAGPRRVLQAGGIPAIAETRAYVRAITNRLAMHGGSSARGFPTP